MPQTPHSLPPPGPASPHQPGGPSTPPQPGAVPDAAARTGPAGPGHVGPALVPRDPSQASPSPAAKAGRTWPIVILRTLSVLILLQVLTQAALAGGFITGNVNLLGLHSANGIALVLTAGALLPAALFLVRPGRGPWWPIVFSVVFWWLIALQVGFGFARLVGLHIPIGVSIMSLISAFTWWSFSHRGAARGAARGTDPGAGQARQARA